MTVRRRGRDLGLAHNVTGSGPPLVLVHGLSGTRRIWQRNIAALAAEFTVYSLDLPSFVETRGVGATLPRVERELVALLDRVGLERTSLVGHSLGGVVCAGVAADHPHLVDRLVLVDAALLSYTPGAARSVVGLVRSLWFTPPGTYPELLRGALRAGPIALVRAMSELLAVDRREQLERISCPTLVVWGENDTICPLTIGEGIASEIPDARLLIVRNAGHNPMWDQPASFNSGVLSFLTSPRADVERDPAVTA